MATYLELHLYFRDNTDLRRRVEVAVVVAAELIRSGTDVVAVGFSDAAGAHDKRKLWAAAVLGSTQPVADQVLKVVLAQNRAATTDQIQNSTDATLQTAVNNAVDLLAGN